jgi:4-amino-4-deoxy-L-arabinose transferase-like glycosyltransferase
VCLTVAVRIVVILWGASRFPPAADGQFYHVVATRIAQGFGYTWLWPDGAVTYAAHYPVGYPALLGGLYALFGPNPVLAMIVNGFAAAVTTFAVHRMALRGGSRGAAITAGIVAALDPTFVFYTPAMMTELLSAALLIASVALSWVNARSRVTRWTLLIVIGILTGFSTLVRPQQIVWAPMLGGWLVFQGIRSDVNQPRRLWTTLCGGVLTTAIAIGVCLPWTLRNCDKMERCVFVSANGGWNLFIGTSTLGRGAWTSIDSIGVPKECQFVFKEAEKDHCFGEAAKRLIRQHPFAWLSLVPMKLTKTFDDVGAPGYYLNASNSVAFDDHEKWWLGASEVLCQRLLLILVAVTVGTLPGPRRRLRRGLAALSVVFLCVPYAWVAILALSCASMALGRRLLKEPAIFFLAAGWLLTAAVHAVFFGGARYAMVVLPLVIVGAARLLGRPWAEISEVRETNQGPIRVPRSA